ncbi:MAG: lipase family protein [Gordonia sp. (in: high G+C Gram-positive bacteria)]|uniref:lipase family protein n=1 Tax=Gordonia sp. (in: high G+C Gram-positive bacteria) TaxID=84139 RepID=UPI0039E4FBB9
MRIRFASLRSVPPSLLGLTAAAAATVAYPFLPTSPSTPTPGGNPHWSGLDACRYSGPIGEPGTLIAAVPLDESLTLSAAGEAHRILYATRDAHGAPAVSTGAIFLPPGPPPRNGYPMIAWAHGTVGLGDDSTPSAHPRTPRDAAYLDHWLRQGYAVVATDYVGLGTPGLMSYLNGEAAARAVVDSMIAARHTGLPLDAKWAAVGQSQGAAAALNTARRATALSAGSGLDYRGVVATGAPANIEQVVRLSGPLFPPVVLSPSLTVYLAYIVAGFTEARPDLHVADLLTDRGREVISLSATMCFDPLSEVLRGERVSGWFLRPLSANPLISAALVDYMRTPYSGYDRPVFLGQGLLDKDVPVFSAGSLYVQMVAAGQPVEFHLYPEKAHNGTVLASTADSTPFLERIMQD